ncbi:hypothetical protein AURDEDRAFT_164423 [Auricularia subglabra TFB-10046 SS5]|nr:hypothetical protein AURDEDRAFT_164423 [Auricularia subglabra TFB-10046 SS5]
MKLLHSSPLLALLVTLGLQTAQATPIPSLGGLDQCRRDAVMPTGLSKIAACI